MIPQPIAASGRLGYVIPACGSAAGLEAIPPADAVGFKLICPSASSDQAVSQTPPTWEELRASGVRNSESSGGKRP